MEKEFVPCAESLALRKLGFDNKCFGAYNKKHKLQISSSDYWDNQSLVSLNAYFGKSTYRCLAPTFSQAFKWFREKYNLFPEIKVEDNVKLGEQKYYWIIKGSYKTSNSNCWIRSIADSENKEYKTYEEAELACLKKLIEIEQNNKTDVS